MEVDHIIELQVTPREMLDAFDHVDNYELLDRAANRRSRNRLVGNIARERAIQVAFNPTLEDQVIPFDRVEQDGGQPGERWTSEEIRHGDQLDAYEGLRPQGPPLAKFSWFLPGFRVWKDMPEECLDQSSTDSGSRPGSPPRLATNGHARADELRQGKPPTDFDTAIYVLADVARLLVDYKATAGKPKDAYI
jgi:hypothetical protein